MPWKLEKRFRYAIQEQDSVNPRLKRSTFFIGPRHVKHHYSKEFIEFSYVTTPNFASEKDCRVFAQNSHVAIEIYDFYAKLFNPDYETVSVYDERFDVQYLFKEPDKWRSIDYYNPTIQVIPLDDGVEIKRIFDTDYGEQSLEISHIVRTGAFLKHKIVFTNKTADTKTFRVVMKLAGITNTKCVHKDGTVEITKETKIGAKPYFFIGEDNQHLKLVEYLWSLGETSVTSGEWNPTTLKDIVFDVHAQGCKADIVIGNYLLAENEQLMIDPDTSTWQVGASGDDARERGDGTFWSDDDNVYVYSNTDPTGLSYYCGGLRWTNVTIPQGASITSAKLTVFVHSATYDDPNMKIYGNKVVNALNFVDNPHIISTTDRPRTTAYTSWVATGLGTGWKEKTGLESVIEEIVGQAGWSSGNALVLLLIANTDASRSFQFRAYDFSTILAAKLEVTWTPPVVPGILMDGFTLMDPAT